MAETHVGIDDTDASAWRQATVILTVKRSDGFKGPLHQQEEEEEEDKEEWIQGVNLRYFLRSVIGPPEAPQSTTPQRFSWKTQTLINFTTDSQKKVNSLKKQRVTFALGMRKKRVMMTLSYKCLKSSKYNTSYKKYACN